MKITERSHIQCILTYSEQIKQAQYDYLRLCGFINEGDLPWVRSAIVFIMEHQRLDLQAATAMLLKRMDFYGKAVEARPIDIIDGLPELSKGIECDHINPTAP